MQCFCAFERAGRSQGQVPTGTLAHRHLAMGTLPVWIKRTQTAGLIVTGAAIGYYYVSPALRVEEVSLPANTLLAKARMFGIDGKKVLVLR